MSAVNQKSFMQRLEETWYENLVNAMILDKNHAAYNYLVERGQGKKLTEADVRTILMEFVRLEIAMEQANHVRESIDYLNSKKVEYETKLRALPYKEQAKNIELNRIIAEFKISIGKLKATALPLLLLFHITI